MSLSEVQFECEHECTSYLAISTVGQSSFSAVQASAMLGPSGLYHIIRRSSSFLVRRVPEFSSEMGAGGRGYFGINLNKV